jgi:hypothetical protein
VFFFYSPIFYILQLFVFRELIMGKDKEGITPLHAAMVSGMATTLSKIGYEWTPQHLTKKDKYLASPLYHHFRMSSYAPKFFACTHEHLMRDLKWYLEAAGIIFTLNFPFPLPLPLPFFPSPSLPLSRKYEFTMFANQTNTGTNPELSCPDIPENKTGLHYLAVNKDYFGAILAKYPDLLQKFDFDATYFFLLKKFLLSFQHFPLVPIPSVFFFSCAHLYYQGRIWQ